MIETTSFFDIIIYNIATPLLISAIAIWMVTDMRRINVVKMINKISEKAKVKAGE